MVLEVSDLEKSFRHPWTLKKIKVLKGISFQVPEPSIVGFLGGNGAGKTTSMKCILGLLNFEKGVVRVFGESSKSLQVKNQIGYLPERPYFYRYLSSEEFLTFYGKMSTQLSKKDLTKRIDELLELVGLTHAKKYLLNQFSKGMLQRIGMAQALIHRPKILILDEPLSGLDPDGRMQMVHVIQTAFDQGTTIFFSSHLLDDVDKICQKLVVIRNGSIAYSGDKETFASRGKKKFEIVFQLGEQTFRETVKDLESAQLKIDELRSRNGRVLHMGAQSISLEDAYTDFHS